MKGLTSAIRTLTVLPVPWHEHEDLSTALPWFPVVGFILGAILYTVFRLWMFLPTSSWPGAGALILVGIEIWLTRGLHMDGLADWADSLGVFQTEKKLAVMKDVSLGTFGGLVLILAFAAKWIAFERMLTSGSMFWILVILAIPRAMMVELQTTLPYARVNGMAGPFVNGATSNHRWMAHGLCFFLCLMYGPIGLVLLTIAWLFTLIFRTYCRNRFNGITGDLLGTADELLEIILLFACALPAKDILACTGWAWVGS